MWALRPDQDIDASISPYLLEMTSSEMVYYIFSCIGSIEMYEKILEHIEIGMKGSVDVTQTW